jgi:hypothetical protein
MAVLHDVHKNKPIPNFPDTASDLDLLDGIPDSPLLPLSVQFC